MQSPPMTSATPAQIRAARALLDWSQDNLAGAAEVSPGSLRALEAGKRPIDSDVARSVQRTLESQGITFVPSDAYAGPGVRWTWHHRPTLARQPSLVTQWDGVPFEIEWQTKVMTAFVSREVLMDLGRLNGSVSDAQLLAVFEQHQARILDAAAGLVTDPLQYDRQGRLHIRSAELLDVGHLTLPVGQLVRLDPAPRRVWRGKEESRSPYLWRIDEPFDPATQLARISNITTSHMVPLHRRHVEDVTEVPGAGGNDAKFTLHLRVQVVFEDGQVRLEPRAAVRNRGDHK